MAINERIRKKVNAKAPNDFTKKNLMYILSKIEEGRQPKRIIESVIDKLAKE